MNHTISSDRQKLTLRISLTEQRKLATAKSLFDRQFIMDFMAPLVCETELKWIKPEFIEGQFSGRTMFGLFGAESTERKGELQGRWDDAQGVSQAWFKPVTEFWVWNGRNSLLEQLRESGQVTLLSPHALDRVEAECQGMALR